MNCIDGWCSRGAVSVKYVEDFCKALILNYPCTQLYIFYNDAAEVIIIGCTGRIILLSKCIQPASNVLFKTFFILISLNVFLYKYLIGGNFSLRSLYSGKNTIFVFKLNIIRKQTPSDNQVNLITIF